MDWTQVLGLAASGAAAGSALVFVLVYNHRAPAWRRSRIGRHLVAVTAVMGLLALYTLIGTTWPGTLAALRVVRSVTVLGAAGLLVQRTVFVVRATRKDKSDEPA